MPRAPRALLALVTVSLALTSCGGSSSSGSSGAASPSPAGFPVTVTGADGELTLDAAPQRIVSMSATATEMLFAVGAGEQVEAVDSTSTYPAEAPVTDLSAFTPSAEAIAGYTPDLVVVSDDVNGLLDDLDQLQIPTLQLDAADTLQESWDQIAVLGDVTGHPDEATAVVADTQDRINTAVASADGAGEGLSVYHELDPTGYSATSSTFIGSVYALFGLTNIADGADDGSGYPQLSAEYVVSAAPDVVVLADTVCCGESAATLAARPAFDTLPAVQSGRVLAADDDVASRWGPRIAELAEQVAETVQG